MKRLFFGALLLAALFVHTAPAEARKIVFVRSDATINHIYSANEDGTALTKLTTTATNRANNPVVCPSTGQIVFWRETSTGAQIWKMGQNGSGATKISQGAPTWDFFPAWSTDCAKIIYDYVTNPNAPAGQSKITQIMVVNADGSGKRTVYPSQPDGFSYIEPVFSPDGTQIAFASNRDGNLNLNQLYVMNSDGTNVRQLTFQTNGQVVSADPFWLPNGAKIGFSHRDEAGNVNLFSVNPDGSGMLQMTQYVEPLEAGDGRWSFDGAKLTFELCQPNGSQQCGGQSNPAAAAFSYTQNTDGTGVVSTRQPCAPVGCAPRYLP